MRLQQRASQVLVLFGVTLIASGAFAASAPMGPPTSEGMMQLRSSRWAASSDQLLVAPYFSISDNQRVRLVLDNRFADPIDYNIRVLSSSGQALPLGGDSLPGRGVLNLDLNQTLETVAPRFREGALEVSYFGDAAMAQAWLIIENSAGVIEEPLAKPTTNQGNQWISFWDTSAVVQGRKGVLYAFHNNSTSPVTLDVSLQGSSAKPKRIHRELPPLHTVLITQPITSSAERSGRVTVRQSGLPNEVSLAGFLLEGELVVGRLPTAEPSEFAENKLLLGLPFPDISGLRGEIAILDTRTGGSAQQVQLRLQKKGDGAYDEEKTFFTTPGEVETVDLTSLLPHPTLQTLATATVSVSADDGGIMGAGWVRGPAGKLIDTDLYAGSKPHGAGTYPVPSLMTHEVDTVFLNLGDEPAEIYGYFVSGRGEYALEPFEVPAQGSFTLDFRKVAEDGPADRLGRTFPKGFDWGFFQWFSRHGALELLARTVVRASAGDDEVGFNCFGCCEEFPSGAIIPSSVGFDVGQSPSFEAMEYVDTCAGTTGPYHAYPDTMYYSSPLSWDAWHISTSAFTNQTVTFQGSGEYMWVTCSTRTRNFWGSGTAISDKCLKDHHPGFDPTKSCAQQTGSCGGCYDCCDKEKEVGFCRCDKVGGSETCKAGVRLACGTCKEVCFGTFLDSCSQQITSCPN